MKLKQIRHSFSLLMALSVSVSIYAEEINPIEAAKTDSVKTMLNESPNSNASIPSSESNAQPPTATEQDTTAPKSSAPIPYKQSSQNIGEQFSSIMLTLGLLCLFAVAVLIFLKKYMVKAGKIPKVVGEHIKVIDVQRLSPRTQVFLLEVDKVTILVTENGDSSQAIQVKPSAVNN